MSEEDTRDATKGLRYLSLSEEEREHNKTETCRHRQIYIYVCNSIRIYWILGGF